MKVLVTGDRGYVGSVLVPVLLGAGHEVVGMDAGWVDGCDFGEAPGGYRQLSGDVRDVTPYHLLGFEAVVHLATIADPALGDLDPAATRSVNLDGSLHLARTARAADVKRFVLGSTGTRPVTAYADSLRRAERMITALACDGFAPSYLRMATVFGSSPRLRTDLPLNRRIAWAVATGREELCRAVTSPYASVHVQDVCTALRAVLEAPLTAVRAGGFGVGRSVGGMRAPAPPGYQPRWTLEAGVAQLLADLRRFGVTLADVDGARFVRVARVRELLASHRMTCGLRAEITAV